MAEHRWDPRCALPPDLVLPRRRDPTGASGPTPGQARGKRFRQTSRGFYVPADVDGSVVEQRILEQSVRVRGYGAVTAWAALRWRGANFFDGTSHGGARLLPVPLVVSIARIRPDERVTISQDMLMQHERRLVDEVWCTPVQRALFDEMRRRGSMREAVVAMDMAAAAGLISVELMRRYVVERAGWTGVPLVREALELAIDDSRSPPETRMRLIWRLDAGLDPPLCNQPVFDLSGRLLGYPDIFDPVAGLAGEYQGADHKSPERHRRDVERQELFRDHGIEMFEVVGGELAHRGLVVRRILNARSRANFNSEDRRRWTQQPPEWWDVPEPLDLRLLRTGEAAELVRP